MACWEPSCADCAAASCAGGDWTAAAVAADLRVEMLRLRKVLGEPLESGKDVDATATRNGVLAMPVVRRLCLASCRARDRAAATLGMATMMTIWLFRT